MTNWQSRVGFIWCIWTNGEMEGTIVSGQQ